MRGRHGEDMCGAIDERGGERLTAEACEIDAAFPANFDRVHARQLTANRVNAGRVSLDVLAIGEETAEKSQRHGAAADVAGADEKDVFHKEERRRRRRFRERKIKLSQVNAANGMRRSGGALT
jgi:hypothetical protein